MPALQIEFSHRLSELRSLYLHQSLARALRDVSIHDLDAELEEYVGETYLKHLAVIGLRGETIFPVPILLRADPGLLGYYRLLYGFSQKEIYTKGPFGKFKTLEEKRIIPPRLESEIEPFCQSLIETAKSMVTGIEDLSLNLIHDLQLLTLGPQLRGGRNNTVGQSAAAEVFDLMHQIVRSYVRMIDQTKRVITIENDSGRILRIEFFADPDIQIIEEARSGPLPRVSIEIKGGGDGSNIHNRLGEAEKSHRNAKAKGFSHFWTMIRVAMDYTIAEQESPTTTHFFNINAIQDVTSDEYHIFRDMLCSILGIRLPQEG
ncbi:hypothetical protein RJ53_04135 [Methanocalculus chunghsingensis]|uniref:XcyI family restriction endonuclease n=1 Tax=Methanocalculus chunghsingensis TaxID=156457 RepID=A0A8J8B3Y8_9EURY|nr:XcyI family restriction endonuclease [Methanocalculus chunghsingensis]MBR1368740.1 hypothetical protein [Methanocalculus chunghsingensis]